MPSQIGYYDTLKSVAGKVFSFLSTITLTGTDGKTVTVTQDTSLDEAVAMSSKAPKANPVFTGTITDATLPAFLAYLSASAANVTGDNTVYSLICDSEVFDQAGNYDVASGLFTAPITGRYRFSAHANMAGLGTAHTGHIMHLVTSNRTIRLLVDSFASNPYTGRIPCVTCLVDMDAGDTAKITIEVDGGTKTVSIGGDASGYYTCFSGELVC